MVIFKKKLMGMETPSVLAEIVKVIITNSAIDPLSIIKICTSPTILAILITQ